MKNRIASLLLAIAMIASLGVSAMAADQKLVNPTGAAKTYTDVPATYHFYQNIQNVTRAGLFQGTTATEFSPYAYMSRGQFVIVLARLDGAAVAGGAAEEGVPTTTSFSDVDANYRFSKAIVWATAHNIITGYSDGTFRPRDPISRAQIAALLHRYLETYKKYTLKDASPIPGQFTDYETTATLADGTTSTACPAVFRADLDYGRRHGLIAGYSDGSYRPNIPVGRAQVAAMLDRIVLNITRRSGGGGGWTSSGYSLTLQTTGAGTYTASVTGKDAFENKKAPSTDTWSGLSGSVSLVVDLDDTEVKSETITNSVGDVTYDVSSDGTIISGTTDKPAKLTYIFDITSDTTVVLDLAALTTPPDVPTPSDGTYTLTLQSKGTGTYTASVSEETKGAFAIEGRTDPIEDAKWSGLSGSVDLVVDLDDTQVKSETIANSDGSAVEYDVSSDGTIIGGTADKPAQLTYSFDITSDTTVVLDLDALAFDYTISAGGKVGTAIGDVSKQVTVTSSGDTEFMTALHALVTGDNEAIVDDYLGDLVAALEEADGKTIPIKDKETVNDQIEAKVNEAIDAQIDDFVDGLDPASTTASVKDGISEAIRKELLERGLISAGATATVEWLPGGSLTVEIKNKDKDDLKAAIKKSIKNLKFLVDGEEVEDLPVTLSISPAKDGSKVVETDTITLGAQVTGVTAKVKPEEFTQAVRVTVGGTLYYKLTVNGVVTEPNGNISVRQDTSFNVTEANIGEKQQNVSRDVELNELLKASQLAKIDNWYDKMAKHLDEAGSDLSTLEALYSKDGRNPSAFLKIGKDREGLLTDVTVNGTTFVNVTRYGEVVLDTKLEDWIAAYDKGIDLVNDLRDAVMSDGSKVTNKLDKAEKITPTFKNTDSGKVGDAAALPKMPNVETVWKALRSDAGVSEIEINIGKVFKSDGQIGAVLDVVLGGLDGQGVYTMSRTLAED